jgi:hypothetical protein
MYNLSKQTSMYLCSHANVKEQIVKLLLVKFTQLVPYLLLSRVSERWVVNNELWRVKEEVIVDYFSTDFICQKK